MLLDDGARQSRGCTVGQRSKGKGQKSGQKGKATGAKRKAAGAKSLVAHLLRERSPRAECSRFNPAERVAMVVVCWRRDSTRHLERRPAGVCSTYRTHVVVHDRLAQAALSAG